MGLFCDQKILKSFCLFPCFHDPGRQSEEKVFSEIASFVAESIRGKLIFCGTIPTPPSEVHRSAKHSYDGYLTFFKGSAEKKTEIASMIFENFLVFIPIVCQSIES